MQSFLGQLLSPETSLSLMTPVAEGARDGNWLRLRRLLVHA